MRTAIFTARDNTALTINILTDEVIDLVQMGPKGPAGQMGPEKNIVRLSKGTKVVKVPAGVFKLISTSKQGVQVTPDAEDVQVVATPDNKGDWPDARLAQTAKAMGADPTVVAQFVADAKSTDVE